jgi:parallel beta-helix repeat protein
MDTARQDGEDTAFNYYYNSTTNDDNAAIGSVGGGLNQLTVRNCRFVDWRHECINIYCSMSDYGITCQDAIITENLFLLNAAGEPRNGHRGIALWGVATSLGEKWARARIENNVIVGAQWTNEGSSSLQRHASGVLLKMSEIADADNVPVVSNNTIIGCLNGIYLYPNSETTPPGSLSAVCRNNLILDPQEGGYFVYCTTATVDQSTFDHNLYHGTGKWRWANVDRTSFEAWKTATSGKDANTVTGDPLLDSEYVPQTGSAAINAGTNTGLTTDYLGNPRPVGAYDIGAFEVQ